MNLDPDLLVAHLPDAAHAPSLEPPPLHSTGTTMAELPTAHARTPSFGRWLIPLVLVAAIVAAAGYEWYRGRPASVAAPPRADADRAGAEHAEHVDHAVAQPGGARQRCAGHRRAAGNVRQPRAAGHGATRASPQPAAPVAANAAVDAVLVIRYEGPSWTEIRDSAGQTLISRLVDADSIEPFDGAPPFSIVIGNARAVTLLYRGQPVDLAPYTRLNVARLVLR